MTPGFPPAMGGALPSAYQFARDPQSGQLVVIPSEHLPHFGKDLSLSLRTILLQLWGKQTLERAREEHSYLWGPAAVGWV